LVDQMGAEMDDRRVGSSVERKERNSVGTMGSSMADWKGNERVDWSVGPWVGHSADSSVDWKVLQLVVRKDGSRADWMDD
jgi:hypothetical protein